MRCCENLVVRLARTIKSIKVNLSANLKKTKNQYNELIHPVREWLSIAVDSVHGEILRPNTGQALKNPFGA